MSKASQLALLKGLADKELDKAIKALGFARKNYIAGEQKLLELIEYKHDYGIQLHQKLKQGITTTTWDNYERFIASMEKAILQQRRHLAELDAHVQAAIKNWQDKTQKLNAYDVLVKRNLQILEKQELKKEQKIMDEYGARTNRREF
ncbi:flagellar export protein FliJ [Thorsellia anophelis]|uniref:Flagellar FliJ protein n=1 Tax=Thorsellia anophelis DSM 18579 TaxID=1123402 RepID=A0A1H9ZVV8_9GAMM|nr:flagellar export protein FliJ [Thorsellia anophelis]SES84996.1 flagellar FliJ protein [Thorsellia anophelis DSM 18579]